MLKKPMTVHARGGKDLIDKVMGKIKARQPDNDDNGTFEVARSSEHILSEVKYVLTTGLEPVDAYTGGMPFGRTVEVFGLEGCLAAETFIHYCICDQRGKIQNAKGGSIETMWHKFHRVELPGKGNYLRDQTANGVFYVPSVNEEGRIFRNRVVGVVKTGQKECFRISTKSGLSIKATADHKFYTGKRYVPASELIEGSTVMIHNSTPFTVSESKVYQSYDTKNVKYYYKGKPKNINGYLYYIVATHRLVYEAAMNGMTLHQYKDLLDSGITELPPAFARIPDGIEIHHKDDDKRNNSIANLEPFSQVAHARFHALKDHNNLRFMAVEDTVVSVDRVGVLDTYDIKCVAPHNNFVANKFVVHNSGKSALALRCCARAQQRFIFERIRDAEGKTSFKRVEDCDVFVLYIDNEQSLDDDQKLVIDGVEVDAMIGRCDTVDQMFKMIETTITAVGEIQEKQDKPCFVVIVTDTIASTSSKEELAADWADTDYVRQPAQLKRGFRRITRMLNRYNVLWICTNQVGDNFAKAKRKYGSMLPRPEDFSTFGGRSLKFFASLRIFVFVANNNYKLNKKSVGGPSGLVAGFITVKNRQAKPLREGRIVLLYDRGLSNIYSILETLVRTKLVDRNERGVCAFRFNAAGVSTETFTDVKSNENPRLDSLIEWPAFYEAHKPDFDKLWARSLHLAFNDDSAVAADDDDDVGLLEDDDSKD